jgi:hypothetical protein
VSFGWRRALSAAVITSMAVQPSAPLLAAALPVSASVSLSRADYDACRSQDESALKGVITALSSDGLTRALKVIDYQAVVGREWRRLDLDTLIDRRVDLAIEDVRRESGWGELLQSLANTEKATKIATSVAERVYQSEPVMRAIEDLATGVAREVGKTMELASAGSEGPLLDCLKAFVGPRYGETVARAVAGDASKSLAVDSSRGSGDVSSGAVLKQTSGGLAGATILIVRRQLANIATRVGQRIAGSILSRLVSVVAGGVGLVLIAKDVWELRYGVLPIISTEMKAPATKAKVQDEIATVISEQIASHIPDIAGATATLVIDVWQDFKRAHAQVLRIADANGNFRAYLDDVAADNLLRLDEVVALVIAREGESGVVSRLADGSLNKAVSTMPEPAMQIARETGSIADALAWTAMASDRLDSIIEFDFHRRAKPADFTRAGLLKVLSLQDRTAIMRIAAAPAVARDSLLALPLQDLRDLARSLTEAELATLGHYLTGLREDARNRVLRSVAAEPVRMRALAPPRVRDAILASADQIAAVDLMLRDKAAVSPQQLLDDATLVWNGRIDPRLLWERHPAALLALLFATLVVVLWLARLLRPRRKPAPAVDS